MESLQENPIYAEKDGKTVSINEVERGLACGCVCPFCRAKLIARKGEINRHHFAHQSKGSCGYNFLYSLYLSAEKMLKKEGYIQLQNYSKPSVSTPFEFKGVKVERERKPRFTISRGERTLEIIFYSTTAEYNRAKRQMCNLNQSAIAIDVTDITYENAEEELRKRLLKSSNYQSWLYNSRKKVKPVEPEPKRVSATYAAEPHEVLPPKEELTCKVVEPIKSAASMPVKKKVDAKTKMKIKLLGERERKIMDQRAKEHAPQELRDLKYIMYEVRAEYDLGITEWAKQAREKVENAGDE